LNCLGALGESSSAVHVAVESVRLDKLDLLEEFRLTIQGALAASPHLPLLECLLLFKILLLAMD
jgi:hypothetical protein